MKKPAIVSMMMGLLLVTLLAGCGGGGSSSHNPPPAGTNIIVNGDFETDIAGSWYTYAYGSIGGPTFIRTTSVSGFSGYCGRFTSNDCGTQGSSGTGILYGSSASTPIKIPLKTGRMYTLSVKSRSNISGGKFTIHIIRDGDPTFTPLLKKEITTTTTAKTDANTDSEAYKPTSNIDATLRIDFTNPSGSTVNNSLDFYIDDIQLIELAYVL